MSAIVPFLLVLSAALEIECQLCYMCNISLIIRNNLLLLGRSRGSTSSSNSGNSYECEIVQLTQNSFCKEDGRRGARVFTVQGRHLGSIVILGSPDKKVAQSMELPPSYQEARLFTLFSGHFLK
ncbi:unnamed protein product [Enterobius vermicularis]|uniref:Dirigent protein n=1 Tax=Enterobius vermicularis TaxID=51028 RepID=A0A0N4VKJ2_ENTVE|nr:unnamed protein product [Enterobius vermicularis]